MKSKIRRRLLLYFVSSFLVFSVMIGVVFAALFSKHNMDVQKAELARRAEKVAETLSGLFEGGRGHGMGHGMYLRFADAIAMSDVWIVDRNREQVTFMHGRMCSVPYRDLPEGAGRAIAEALEGRTAFSEGFGAYLGTPAITVATPIIARGGAVVGAALLHREIADIDRVTGRGLLILLTSMGAAVVLSFFVAGALAARFTKPLGMMKQAAARLSAGDYAARTGVSQDDEIGELAAVMDGAAERLGEASRESAKLETLRRDFIANISHELRTPVTVIRGSLDALCDGVVTEPNQVAAYHRQMLSESAYLERLVSDLLDLARLQNPDFAIDAEELDLRELAEDAIRGMRRIAERKGVRIALTPEAGRFTTTGDYGRLRQMLVVVLDNAAKFSPEGGTVRVALADEGGSIRLSVRDEGRGIAPEDLPHIFERFYRQRSEENKSGTGLGLAIAKQIADRHGASVEVRSEPGEGAAFSFVFGRF